MECLDKSPVVNVGRTFVTKFGNVTLNKIIDNNDGQITVTPKGYPSVTRTTHDYTLESFYDGLMTVKTNFFTLAGRGAHFWVCGAVEDEPTTCTQTFKLQDQNGNPLNGNVKIGTTNITVLGTGTISLEQGKAFTAVASFGDKPTQTKTFTSCTSAIIFTFEVPTIGTLNCYSVPTGADIFVDDVHKGQTDLENIELEPGTYTVILKKSGYNDVTKTVTIELGIPGTISVNLTPSTTLCNQHFQVLYGGEAVAATVTVNDTDVPTNPEGGTLTLITGDTCEATARYKLGSLTKTFVACTGDTLIFDIGVVSESPIEGDYLKPITYVIESSIGMDEITFSIPFTNVGTKTSLFYVVLYDATGKKIDTEPDIARWPIFPDKSSTIKLSSKLKLWHIGDVQGQTVTFKLFSRPISITGNYEVVDTQTVDVETYDEDEDDIITGKMGVITQEITPQIGNDEVKFDIQVTNTSSKEQCFFIKVYDDTDKYIARSHTAWIITKLGKSANKIAPGDTEIITLDSDGMLWHVNDVEGQTITFKLFADSPFLTVCPFTDSKYSIVDTKTYVMESHYDPDKDIFVPDVPDIGKDAPTMKLPIIVLKGSTVNITGTYEPNDTLGLYIDKKLPKLDELVKEFTTDSSGDYEIEFEFDKTGIYKMYVSHCLLCKKSERSTIIVIDYIQIALILTAIGMMIWKIRRKK